MTASTPVSSPLPGACPSTLTPECVPKTQPDPDTLMIEPAPNPAQPPAPPEDPSDKPKSWKNVLTTVKDDRISIFHDFLKGKISVAFPEGESRETNITIEHELLEVLVAAWSSSLIIKTLGTLVPYEIMFRKLNEIWKPRGKMTLVDLSNGYYLVKFEEEDDYMATLTGGPWTGFGHYIVIKPWTPNFYPLTDVIESTPAWIRFTNLPVILYEEQPAAVVGTLIKVDKRTLHANRGGFARICVELYITKPLKGVVVINGSRFLLEYEGLHTICFQCGRFGHFQPSCPLDPVNIAKREAVEKAEAAKALAGPEKLGVWMENQRRRRAIQRKAKS
ncbi:hypothetical protein V2J09_014615 [Rumex salicifolius]